MASIVIARARRQWHILLERSFIDKSAGGSNVNRAQMVNGSNVSSMTSCILPPLTTMRQSRNGGFGTILNERQTKKNTSRPIKQVLGRCILLPVLMRTKPGYHSSKRLTPRHTVIITLSPLVLLGML